MENIKVYKSSKGGLVSEKDLLQVKVVSRTQVGIGNLLNSRIKKMTSLFMHHMHLGLIRFIHLGMLPLNNYRKTQKKDSRKNPRVGKKSTSYKEVKVQSC